MRGDLGQSTIEAVFAVPLCLVFAAGLVDVGVLVRDQLALTSAAGQAGAAQLAGDDAAAVAGEAVPASLRRTISVKVTSDSVRVAARSRTLLLSHVTDTTLHADAVTAVGGGAR